MVAASSCASSWVRLPVPSGASWLRKRLVCGAPESDSACGLKPSAEDSSLTMSPLLTLHNATNATDRRGLYTISEISVHEYCNALPATHERNYKLAGAATNPKVQLHHAPRPTDGEA